MTKSEAMTKLWIGIIITVTTFVSYFTVQYIHSRSHSASHEFQNLSQGIDSQLYMLDYGLREIEEEINNGLDKTELDKILNKRSLLGFIYYNDSLVYWNDYILDASSISKIPKNKTKAYKLSSGWYLISNKTKGDFSYYIIDIIKTDYQLNNPSMKPVFNKTFYSIDNLELSDNEKDSEFTIVNDSGNFLIGANTKVSNAQSKHYHLLSLAIFILFILSFSYVLYTTLNELKLFRANNNLRYLVFLVSTTSFYFLLLFFKLPTGLYNSLLFAASGSSISIINSYGEAYILSVFLIVLSIAGYKIFSTADRFNTPVIVIIRNTFLWIYTLITIFIVYKFTILLDVNSYSDLDFSNNNLFHYFSLIVLISISSYFFIATYLLSANDSKPPILSSIIISLFGLAVVFLTTSIDETVLIIAAITALNIILIKHFVWNKITDIFLGNLLILVYYSLVISFTINIAITNKDDNNQLNIAEVLALPNDVLFEENFSTKISSIRSDSTLIKLVFEDSIGNNIEAYLKEKYFDDSFSRYSIQITNCNKEELIAIQPEGEIQNCTEYFNTLISDFSTEVIDSILYQFDSKTDGYYYICNLTFSNSNSGYEDLERSIYIEFVSSFIPDGLGYPELLFDRQSQIVNLANYSFARYDSKVLEYKFGDFAYNTYFASDTNFTFGDFFNYNGYKHLAIKTSPNIYLIVSRKIMPITIRIAIFSLLFIVLSVIGFLVYMVIYARNAIEAIKHNFKTRLQTFVLATLTITFIIVSVSSLFFIKQNIRQQLEKKLSENSASVLIELQHKLSNISNLNDESPVFLENLLRKFSLVFFSDINLFDKSGKLIASSRPEIFEKNLLSTHINPKAYDAIFDKKELNFISEEKIGSIKYFSSYVPINLGNNQPVGIVNLPYFARQSEYTESYFVMLSYLLNIYVIVGILGALIAVIFSRYLTRPLVLLQKNLADLRIEKENAKILWNKNDEIGQLIKEYNNMVEKLKQSTDLLLRSERESAWREIAKQIAHEIKNPLTPMKLNVQYLEKAFNDNDADFKNKLNSVSKTLINQIDTLDSVAEKFSDFAKINHPEFEIVDLKQVVISSIDLFTKKSGVNISLKAIDDSSEFIIRGVEKDLIRVFNNIITNSIQALNESKNPRIIIELAKTNGLITVSINDNGKGVPKAMFTKIFQPYFTTKTSGTGLGLAIVKNIISDMNGEITFDSDSVSGTTFYLNFPEYNQ